ncbi:MAG: aminopeptidase P family N-terminal domain-containing protein, partial [Neisseriaceae bacterium]|nr:aminopeptidase P family N-terminal domain-containing protein [Neisseriaceae bacterium]
MTSPLSYTQKLAACRLSMRTHQIDFLVVPPADPHLSEYLPEHFQTYQWLSGFTGSVATLVITQDWAGCWVDSRYWEQADIELAGSEFAAQKVISPAHNGYVDWLAEKLQKHQVLAINGQVCSLALHDTLS